MQSELAFPPAWIPREWGIRGHLRYIDLVLYDEWDTWRIRSTPRRKPFALWTRASRIFPVWVRHVVAPESPDRKRGLARHAQPPRVGRGRLGYHLLGVEIPYQRGLPIPGGGTCLIGRAAIARLSKNGGPVSRETIDDGSCWKSRLGRLSEAANGGTWSMCVTVRKIIPCRDRSFLARFTAHTEVRENAVRASYGKEVQRASVGVKPRHLRH